MIFECFPGVGNSHTCLLGGGIHAESTRCIVAGVSVSNNRDKHVKTTVHIKNSFLRLMNIGKSSGLAQDICQTGAPATEETTEMTWE